MGLLRMRARDRDFLRGIEIALFETGRDGALVSVARTVTMESCESECLIPAMCELTPDAAQLLMDDLWRCGLRPTEARLGNESVQAMKEHIGDLRRMAFDVLAKPSAS